MKLFVFLQRARNIPQKTMLRSFFADWDHVSRPVGGCFLKRSWQRGPLEKPKWWCYVHDVSFCTSGDGTDGLTLSPWPASLEWKDLFGGFSSPNPSSINISKKYQVYILMAENQANDMPKQCPGHGSPPKTESFRSCTEARKLLKHLRSASLLSFVRGLKGKRRAKGGPGKSSEAIRSFEKCKRSMKLKIFESKHVDM